MNVAAPSVTSTVASTWRADLAAAGFRPLRSGRAYRLGRLTFAEQCGWAVMTGGPRRARKNLLPGSFGTPGLWRWVLADSGRSVQHAFELPPWVLRAMTGADAFRDALDWALSTGKGTVPPGWTAPPLEEAESLLPPERLTVRAGSIVRQGRLIREPARLALRFPIFSCVPADLSLTRRRWLEALLEHEQSRWRLVRVGIDDASSVQAEVDLSGAPCALLPRLLEQALDALRLLVKSIVEPVDFLVTRPEEGRALDTPPCGPAPR